MKVEARMDKRDFAAICGFYFKIISFILLPFAVVAIFPSIAQANAGVFMLVLTCINQSNVF